MPLDSRRMGSEALLGRASRMEVPPLPKRDRAVAAWLFGVAAMVVAMIALGGATRLTGSGLSIMEWAPLTGWIPPWSDAEWQRLFDLYRTIPQYAQVNRGMTLAEFEGIFWLEYLHRVWGRLIGLAFALPLAWFVWRGRVGRRLGVRLGGLLLLGGMQGAIGWFMVASGFDADRTSVSPYRLVLHLGMAFALLGALVWFGLGQWHGDRRGSEDTIGTRGADPVRTGLLVLSGLVALTMLAGGFVAGTKAGFTWNTFPLMDGRLVPEGYGALSPWWRDAFENLATVQFHHRVLASATLLAALWVGLLAWRETRRGRRSALAASGAVLVQYALGVATLLWVVPVGLGTLHQTAAAVVLVLILVAVHTRQDRDAAAGSPR